jgi:predicted nucleic acid-binding protein
MSASRSQRALVAVDTNVLLDLAVEVDDVTDAVEVIRRRLHQPQMLIPPTVREELAAEALHADGFEHRENARRAFQLARRWSIQPFDLVGAQQEVARSIGRRLRSLGLLREEEVNDGLILAEAALFGCLMLLTSDEHLRGVDFDGF